MAFVTIEDFYGKVEVIVFDSVFSKTSSFLINENVVIVEGRLSIREDEDAKIVATDIKEFSEEMQKHAENKSVKLNTIKTLVVNITNLDENTKTKLRGAIKFFSGENSNVKLVIQDEDVLKPCGGLFLTDKVLSVFKNIVTEENIKLE